MFSITRESVLLQAQHILQFSSTKSPKQRRLLSSLAILEQREGKLQNASLRTVTAAQKVGGSITGFIAGSGVKSVAEEAAKVRGIGKIIMVENGSYDKVSPIGALFCFKNAYPNLILNQGLAESYAPLLAKNIEKEGFTHIFAGHSAFGKNLMPRVAALLDVQQISDITAIESEDSAHTIHGLG